jgi:hypothetical protein
VRATCLVRLILVVFHGNQLIFCPIFM